MLISRNDPTGPAVGKNATGAHRYGEYDMNEERVSNIAQASFLAGAGLYIGYTFMKMALTVVARFIGI